mgnify:CR=1 FL=1
MDTIYDTVDLESTIHHALAFIPRQQRNDRHGRVRSSPSDRQGRKGGKGEGKGKGGKKRREVGEVARARTSDRDLERGRKWTVNVIIGM